MDEEQNGLAEELAALRVLSAQLQAENTRLLKLLELTPRDAKPPGPTQTGFYEGRPGPVSGQSPPQQKLEFFAALFASRTDVYAIRWDNVRTGKGGWMPAVRGGFRKATRHEDRDYLPLTDKVFFDHLTGDGSHLGLYPLLDRDVCHWLAADFDGQAAMLDALAYVKAARNSSVPAALEVSRSGVGAHVWIFFTNPIPAESARKLGTVLLREAMALRGHMSLESYDRLFPSQDVLPTGGIGNLIAAPLYGKARKSGATLFLDLSTMEPHTDQFAYLSSLGRMTPSEVTRVARRAGQLTVGASVSQLGNPVSTKIQAAPAPIVHLRLSAGVRVESAELTPALLATLKHAASMHNPAFYERQRMRMPTYGTSRFIHSYDETLDGGLVLPRGLIENVTSLVEQAGSRIDITDVRGRGTSQSFASTATLTAPQRAAIAAIREHDLGVLVAPPGSGRTVMACAMIAERATSTLILLDRKALADQWRSQIQDLLGTKPGQFGGGRKKTTGAIDIVMLPSLIRRDDIESFTSPYGFVIADECHHIPSTAYDHAIKQIPARYWLGLTATPYRRDKLDDLIGLQLGPIRHTITAPAAPRTPQLELTSTRPTPVLHVHETTFHYTGDADPQTPGGMSKIYKALRSDSARTDQVVADVLAALARGRHCLILTQWKSHVSLFADALRDHDPVVLVGGTSATARRDALTRLIPRPDGPPLLAIATGPYIGEGFDCPPLDTVFLAVPIAQKTNLVQWVGRILRPYPGKATAEVHDYHDVHTGVLASPLAKRTPGYTTLGFPNPRKL